MLKGVRSLAHSRNAYREREKEMAVFSLQKTIGDVTRLHIDMTLKKSDWEACSSLSSSLEIRTALTDFDLVVNEDR